MKSLCVKSNELSYKRYAKACSAKDIHNINATKVYRIIALPLIKHLCEDESLSDGAFRLYMYLYSISGCNDELEIKICVSTLSRLIGKSDSRVRVYIRELEQLGYLIKIHSISEEGIQASNRLKVRFPIDVVQHIKETEIDRKSLKSNNSKSSSGLSVTTIEPNKDSNINMSIKPSLKELLKESESLTPDEKYQIWKKTCKSNNKSLGKANFQKNDRNNSCSTKRVFTHTRIRIKERLTQMGVIEQQDKILEEIIYSTTQGTLSHLSIQHAINTALKCIRENRWRSTQLENNMVYTEIKKLTHKLTTASTHN